MYFLGSSHAIVSSIPRAMEVANLSSSESLFGSYGPSLDSSLSSREAGLLLKTTPAALSSEFSMREKITWRTSLTSGVSRPKDLGFDSARVAITTPNHTDMVVSLAAAAFNITPNPNQYNI